MLVGMARPFGCQVGGGWEWVGGLFGKKGMLHCVLLGREGQEGLLSSISLYLSLSSISIMHLSPRQKHGMAGKA